MFQLFPEVGYQYLVFAGILVGVTVGVFVGVFDGVAVAVFVGVSVAVFVGVAVGVSVAVLLGVIVGVTLGVEVGVSVGVIVGVSLGVLLGVFVGVLVGVLVGVSVGVAVGVLVGVGPLSELTTSPAELPFLFHVPRSCGLLSEDSDTATDCGEFAELTVVGLDHEVYGLLASVYLIDPDSRNQLTKLFVAV